MIYLYITPSCQSCRKAIKWFEEHQIEYKSINILQEKLTKEDVFRMLKNTFNGFEDIISTKSKPYIENNLKMDDMKTSELINFIIENPTVLRRPIIVAKNVMEVGYNADDIRMFIPPEKRFLEYLLCDDCPKLNSKDCEHKNEALLLVGKKS